MNRRLICKAVFGCLLTLGLVHAAKAKSAPWLPFGPDGGDARKVVTDPHDHLHLFLGTESGWIYETRNGGSNWRRLSQIAKRDDLVIDSIVVDSTSSKHLVVGAWALDHPDGGIFISNDGGLTWINQAEMRGQSVRSLTQSVSDPKTMVAGSLLGVFRTSDGGQRWKRISPQDSTEIHEVESVAIDPIDPKVIYAGTWHLPWKTTDGGEHWDNIKDGIIDDSDVFSIIVDPKSPKIVYASACSGIYKSVNAGLHFEKIQGIPSESRRTRILFQDPEDRNIVFAGTTEGLFRSEDAGKTWTAKTGKEIIVNDVAVDPSNSQRLLIAIDRGGVMSSDDGGETFHPSNAGFSARQITALKKDAFHPATVYVGVVNDKEWGGVFQSDNGGLNWAQRSDGLEGRDVFALGQSPDGNIIAGTSHGLFRLDREEQKWKRINNAPDVVEPADKPAVHPLAIATRPSVSIGRNHFAEHKASPTKTALLKTKTRSAGLRKNPSAPLKAARRSPASKKTPQNKRTAVIQARGKHISAKPVPTIAHVRAPALKEPAPPQVPSAVALVTKASGFDGSVNVLGTAGEHLLAATSQGLLLSADNGETWTVSGPPNSAEWRFLATAKLNVVAASLHDLQFSSDAGSSWVDIPLPEELTRVSAVAVEPSGTVWVGGNEGVFATTDGGTKWTTPKNLFINSISSLFFDESSDRLTVTTAGVGTYKGIVFTVQMPERTVSYTDTGWTLRFARPVGDHLIAATLFDGIVVQPKMIASPVTAAESASR